MLTNISANYPKYHLRNSRFLLADGHAKFLNYRMASLLKQRYNIGRIKKDFFPYSYKR